MRFLHPAFGLILCAGVAGCATPVIILKNPQTGQVATCGGGVGGSLLGGVAGYNIEQSIDRKCQARYMSAGYERVRE